MPKITLAHARGQIFGMNFEPLAKISSLKFDMFRCFHLDQVPEPVPSHFPPSYDFENLPIISIPASRHWAVLLKVQGGKVQIISNIHQLIVHKPYELYIKMYITFKKMCIQLNAEIVHIIPKVAQKECGNCTSTFTKMCMKSVHELDKKRQEYPYGNALVKNSVKGHLRLASVVALSSSGACGAIHFWKK